MTYDCHCNYNSPSFYLSAIRRARKAHECEECNGSIFPGERYECVVGKWDDCVSRYKTCQRCYDIRQWVKNNVPCLCCAHGTLIEDCREAIDSASYRAPGETSGLRFGFLRRVVARNKFNKSRKSDSSVVLREAR